MLLWSKVCKEHWCHGPLRRQHPLAFKASSISLLRVAEMGFDPLLTTPNAGSAARLSIHSSPAALLPPGSFLPRDLWWLLGATAIGVKEGEGLELLRVLKGQREETCTLQAKPALQKSLESSFTRKVKGCENPISLAFRDLKWNAKALSAGPGHEQNLHPES